MIEQRTEVTHLRGQRHTTLFSYNIDFFQRHREAYLISSGIHLPTASSDTVHFSEQWPQLAALGAPVIVQGRVLVGEDADGPALRTPRS